MHGARASAPENNAARNLQALQPGFLIFVFGLGIIVAAASDNGLTAAVRAVLPHGESYSYSCSVSRP